MMVAQNLSEHYDGILAGVPGLSWSKFLIGGMYPQIVTYRDLGGVPLTAAQGALLGNAAIAACDVVGGQHLGYILDQKNCRYDPTKDASVLCVANGGTNATAACVTPVQALAMNKMWYGLTSDGSVPDPAVDNGWDSKATGLRRWYGLSRGTPPGSLAGATASGTFSDMLANAMLDPTMSVPSFKNARGNGQYGYRTLSYDQLARAFDNAVTLQPQFSYSNADNPDLSALKARGTKLIHFSALNDELIVPQGAMQYYDNVLATMGGLTTVQQFYRFYILPGTGHAAYINGTTNPQAKPPLVARFQLFNALKAWVESGTAPGDMTLSSSSSSLPLCAYPAKPAYLSGDAFQAASYKCQ